MLDTWTKEEGTEMIEIGSGVFVIIVIFILGLVAAVMWFWPHLSPSMKSRFVKLLPCCFSLEEADDLMGSSGHSELSMASSHSTAPLTSASRKDNTGIRSPFSHSQSVETDDYASSTSRSTSLRPMQQSTPPPHSSASSALPHQRYAPGITSGPNQASPPSTRTDVLSAPPQHVSQAPPFVGIRSQSQNQSNGTPQPLQKFKVNPPPPVSHTQLQRVPPNSSPPPMTYSQPPESRGGRVKNIQKTSQSRGSSKGSSAANQYTRNL